MITIELEKCKHVLVDYYAPKTKADETLMQHCVNEDVDAITESALVKARHVAAAHGWEIKIV